MAAKLGISLASAKIIVGNVSNVATAVDLAGDATIDNAGAMTIGNNKITDAKVSAHTTTKITTTNKALLNSAIAYNDQLNTFSAGKKQTMQADATNAGFRLAGVAADPSVNVLGDLWLRSDLLKFRYYDGATIRNLVTEQLAQTLLNKTIDPVLNTFTNVQQSPEKKMSGGLSLAAAATANGTLSGMIAGTGTLTSTSSTTEGYFKRPTTTNVSGNFAGYRFSIFAIRNQNPRIKVKFKLAQTAVQRLNIMFSSGSSGFPGGDDPLNALSGFGLHIKSTDTTTFYIAHNDGAGATVDDSTGVATDTNKHTIELQAVAASNKFQWSLDGSAFADVTTEIPAAGDTIGMWVTIETAEAVAKNMDVYYIWAEWDQIA